MYRGLQLRTDSGMGAACRYLPGLRIVQIIFMTDRATDYARMRGKRPFLNAGRIPENNRPCKVANSYNIMLPSTARLLCLFCANTVQGRTSSHAAAPYSNKDPESIPPPGCASDSFLQRERHLPALHRIQRNP